MELVNLTPDDLARYAEQQRRLEADFPDWWFHHHRPDTLDADWEARRREDRYPVGGGVAWIRADSAERLRELLVAAQGIEVRR